MPNYAGIELGGTKVICGLASGDGELLERRRVPTVGPVETLAAIAQVLGELVGKHGPVDGLGIGSFGPVRLDPKAADFGHIGPTPKKAWRGVDIAGFFRDRFEIPVVLDTDVTAAAFGEAAWGSARNCDSLVYITVGTGIGAGALVNGAPVHGLLHPEVGHMRVPHAADDDYGGHCSHHGDCVEGMAAGPAIVARWGEELGALPEDHRAYQQTAHYLAHLVVNIVLVLAPEKVILGGGVMSNVSLFTLIRGRVQEILNGYLPVEQLTANIDDYIVPPELGNDVGILGAIAMVSATSG